MAIPASVIPPGNSYSVHLAGGSLGSDAPESFDTLTLTAAAAGALLRARGVDVRRHLTGDDPRTQKRRDFLTRAGAKASAFSPAPAPGIPGEGFWKTTLAVVEASGNEDFWWPPRADKKVEWEPLWIALCDARGRLPRIAPAQIAAPDLWIVASRDGHAEGVLEEWIRNDAGAAAVLSPIGVAWSSRNAAFGNAAGARLFAEPVPLTEFTFGCFAGGVVASLIEELLGENLFDKSIVRAERDELEVRPLHAARAAALGGAAARASREETPERLLHKDGELAGRVRALLRADRPEGEPKPWGSKGR